MFKNFNIDRQVSKSEGEDIAKKWGIPFLETSAKNRTNIDESFVTLLRQIPRTGTDYKLVTKFRD
jgi:GTPase KRas protein